MINNNTPSIAPRRPAKRRSSYFVPLLSLGLASIPFNAARGENGTWTLLSSGNASGTWSNTATGNWDGGIVADGSAFTARFDTLDIAGATNSTVTLSGARTIGNLIFGDTDTATAKVWILSGSSILTLAGAHTITNTAAGENSRAAINVTIAGTDGLLKTGQGIISLGAANTYTGDTTISEGRLRVRNSAALGVGAVTIANGAGLEVDNSVTVANHTINLNGSSALVQVTGTNTLSGAVNLQSASTIAMTGSSGTLSISGPLNIGEHQLTVEGSRQLTLGGTITGTGTLNMTGVGGTTVITHDNGTTFGGRIQVGRNTLAVGHNGALGTGNLLLGVNDQDSRIRSTDTTTRTIANAVLLTGTENSTYHFGHATSADLNGGLTFADTTEIAIGSVSKKFVVNNRTQFAAGFTGSGGIMMQTGTGTLVLNGANTYTGATTISAGTLQIGNGGTTGSLSDGTAITNNGALVFNRSDDYTVENTISGTGSVTQAGTGALIFSTAKAYGGATTVNAGTLLINNSKTGAGLVTVNSTGTLGGSGTIAGTTTINSGAFLSAGASSGAVGTLTFNSTLDISGLASGTGGLLFDLGATNASDKIATGALTIGSGLLDINDFSFTTLAGYGVGTYTLFSGSSIVGSLGSDLDGMIGGLSGVIAISGNDIVLSVSAIPEPSTYAAIAGALVLGVVVVRRCRRALAEAQA